MKSGRYGHDLLYGSVGFTFGRVWTIVDLTVMGAADVSRGGEDQLAEERTLESYGQLGDVQESVHGSASLCRGGSQFVGAPVTDLLRIRPECRLFGRASCPGIRLAPQRRIASAGIRRKLGLQHGVEDADWLRYEETP